MAKSTKKAPVKATKSITDFFARIPSSSQGTSTASSQPRLKVEGESASSQSQTRLKAKGNGDHALRSSNASNSRVEGSSLFALSSPRKPIASQRLQPEAPSRTVSLKRTRSPDSSKSSTKARKQRESEEGQLSETNKTTPNKKARLSSPFSALRDSGSSLVPSSQSDEEELATPLSESSSKSDVKQSVKKWRKYALPPTPDPADDSMLMEVDDSGAVSGPSTPGFQYVEHLEPSTPNRIPTPPYTDGSSDGVAAAPPTPVALNAETKMAKILQDIKARAAAAAQSSPELDVNDAPDFLEDSDDDDALFQSLLQPRAAPLPVASSSSTNGSGEKVRRSSRQRTSLGASSNGSPISRHGRLSLLGDMSSEDGPAPARPRARPNPIAALLKEKRQAEKSGKGSDAFSIAEKSLFGKGSLLEEMNLEDGDDNELDYDTLKNIQSPPPFVLNGYSPENSVFLKEEDRKVLFTGSDDGKEINGILKDDHLARQAEERQRKREGVALWAPADEGNGMMIDAYSSIPEFALAGNSTTLQLLGKALCDRDFDRATWILTSGALAGLRAADQPGIISDLCVLATCCTLLEMPVSNAAFHVVLALLDRSSTHEGKCPVSPSFVLRSMLELGAPAQHLESVGLKFEPTPCASQVDQMKRDSVLYRAIALISQAATARRLAPDEVPDLVVALVLIAMDPSTSHDLWKEIMVAVNHVCQSVSPVNGSNREAEGAIASRMVALSDYYDPVNKAALISVLAGGTGATMRIARFTAYSIIVRYPSSSITPTSYCDPAPLLPLLNQLFQPKETDDIDPSEITVFAINDDTDYTAMKHYVYILGVAITNVKAYVDVERQKAKENPRPIGPSRESDGPKKVLPTDLELLHTLLEDLHASINDLRAAHLDRSRTKAVVKQLQMRIYYQRDTFGRAWKDQNKPKTLMKNWLTAGKAKVPS